MNTRVLDPGARVAPPVERRKPRKEEKESTPDAVVFDKAEEAASVEAEREAYKALLEKVAALEEQLKTAAAEETDALKAQLERATAGAEAAAQVIVEREAELKKQD